MQEQCEELRLPVGIVHSRQHAMGHGEAGGGACKGGSGKWGGRICSAKQNYVRWKLMGLHYAVCGTVKCNFKRPYKYSEDYTDPLNTRYQQKQEETEVPLSS